MQTLRIWMQCEPFDRAIYLIVASGHVAGTGALAYTV